MSLIELFKKKKKIGAILLGGGYIILPILTNEFVEKRNIISHDEILDFYALSQSLPGIIAANMSMFIGYKLKGKIGAVIAVFGIILVPFLCIVILASILNTIVSNQYIQGIFWGIGIAVIALILLTIREIWQKSNKNLFFYIIFVSALASILILKLSPIETIIIFSVLGVVIKRFIGGRK